MTSARPRDHGTNTVNLFSNARAAALVVLFYCSSTRTDHLRHSPRTLAGLRAVSCTHERARVIAPLNLQFLLFCMVNLCGGPPLKKKKKPLVQQTLQLSVRAQVAPSSNERPPGAAAKAYYTHLKTTDGSKCAFWDLQQHLFFRKCLSILTRAPPQLCNLFGRECNSTEVTKNRNGRPATKRIGMAIWPQKE